MRWVGDLDDQSVWAILLALTASALGVALAFEHIGGLKPCPLCYQQRWPYYALIALSAAALCALHFAKPPDLSKLSDFEGGTIRTFVFGALFARIALAVAFLTLMASAAMGVHHAGVEWKWWPGPDACAGGGAAADAAGSLIERMQAAQVVRCDEAAGRFLGLSFAGYNALFSLGLAAFLALHFYLKANVHNYVGPQPLQSETNIRQP